MKVTPAQRKALARAAMFEASGLPEGASVWAISRKLSPSFHNWNGKPISFQAVMNWWDKGIIPSRHVPKLAELAGLDLSDIDPMVFPP